MFPPRLDYGRSPHAYVNQRLQIQLELLMMSGVPLETCSAFNERWNNKFCYKVASCWLFLLNHIYIYIYNTVVFWLWSVCCLILWLVFMSVVRQTDRRLHISPNVNISAFKSFQYPNYWQKWVAMTGNFLVRILSSVCTESCHCACHKAYSGVVVHLCSSLTSALDGIMWTDLLPGRSTPWGRDASTDFIKRFFYNCLISKTLNITISLNQMLAHMYTFCAA